MRVERLSADGWRRYRNIRLVALSDMPDAFGSTYGREALFDVSEWRRRLSNGSATFVAVRDGKDVGTATGAVRTGHDRAAGLFGMWVAPGARRGGVGSALLRAVIDWARAEGLERIDLDVTDTNRPAITFYEKLGFLPTGLTGSLPSPRDHILEHQRSLLLRRG